MAVDIDEAKVWRSGTGLMVGWAAATVLGMVIGYLPAALFVDQVELGLARVLVPLFAGVLIGLAQWFVLRNYVRDTGDWVWNMIGSWVAGYTVGLFVVSFFPRGVLSAALAYIIFGVIVSVIQYPVLRREIPRLGMWMLSNVVGWALGAIMSQLLILLFFGGTTPSLLVTTLINSIVTGLIAGLITGAALMSLARFPDLADVNS